jgi:hypothetical protein
MSLYELLVIWEEETLLQRNKSNIHMFRLYVYPFLQSLTCDLLERSLALTYTHTHTLSLFLEFILLFLPAT